MSSLSERAGLRYLRTMLRECRAGHRLLDGRGGLRCDEEETVQHGSLCRVCMGESGAAALYAVPLTLRCAQLPLLASAIRLTPFEDGPLELGTQF